MVSFEKYTSQPWWVFKKLKRLRGSITGNDGIYNKKLSRKQKRQHKYGIGSKFYKTFTNNWHQFFWNALKTSYRR